ncbi:hypothetical protein KXW62_000815 [Aspergillus fumigatus]|nr:hypothetical protein KXW62_000815 [Aspergillus fumigatus]
MAGSTPRQPPTIACEECRRKESGVTRPGRSARLVLHRGQPALVLAVDPTLPLALELMQRCVVKRTSRSSWKNNKRWPCRRVGPRRPLAGGTNTDTEDGSRFDPHQNLTPVSIGSELQITPMMHNDLDQLYFDRAYVFAPIVQAHRYRSWSKQTNKSKEKTCLQRAMWTLASSLSSQFQVAGRQFYAETRQLLHALESEEPGHQISIEQAQAWTLLAIYELTCEDYHRGYMNWIFSPSPPPKQARLSPQGQVQEDWIDLETKRRTFWLAYTLDRFTSMVDGLHLFFDERTIRTRLPAPKANFASGRPTETSFLPSMIQVIDLDWPETELSSLKETVIVATICGQVLEHKQRPPSRTSDSTATTYDFCRRHRLLNALLAQRIKMLRLRASFEHLNPVFTFTALATYIAVLTLYNVIQSQPLGTEAQAMQLTKALHSEHQQQSLDAVADVALLVTALGQHFQTHPLVPILLFLAARFSQTHPELNDAYNKLMPCILSALQGSTNPNKLAQHFLQLLGPQTDNGQPVP